MRTASCLVLMLAAFAAADADAHGRHGRWWGGVSIGIGVPLYLGSSIDPWYGYPAPVVVAPPPVVYAEPAPVPISSSRASRSRAGVLLIRYSASPFRHSLRQLPRRRLIRHLGSVHANH